MKSVDMRWVGISKEEVKCWTRVATKNCGEVKEKSNIYMRLTKYVQL